MIALTCGGLAAALSATACWRLRDTTFAAPCAWAAFSFAMLAADAAWAAGNAAANRLTAMHLEYLAAVTVVAPFVALLGAKRPQHVAWQWIVASLVALLAFQDLRSWLIEGVKPSPHAAWQWLLAALLLMQVCNYLPTRYATAAILAAAGQLGVLASSFSFLPAAPPWVFTAGVVSLSLAVLWAAILSRRRRRVVDAWRGAWLDFRDLYGVLWAVRVCQRVNAVSAGQTRRQLSWQGISPVSVGQTPTTDEGVDQDAEPLRRSLRAVLARFLSPAWPVN